MNNFSMQNSSYTIQKSSPSEVVIQRKTAESDIVVTLSGSWKGTDVTPRQCQWNTGIAFFNHMIQLVCRRAGLNIDAEFRCVLPETFAAHVVWEDVGMAMGACVNELLARRRQDGVEGAGGGTACIDEALSSCYMSFEGRSNCFIIVADSSAAGRELVEDAKMQDARQFFEGFAQGARSTIHLTIGAAEDTHHLWESAFRAFGEALRVVLQPNEWRKGVIVGVKDTGD